MRPLLPTVDSLPNATLTRPQGPPRPLGAVRPDPGPGVGRRPPQERDRHPRRPLRGAGRERPRGVPQAGE